MKNNQTLMWILVVVIIVLFFGGFGMIGFPFGGMMSGMFGYNYGFMPLFGWIYMTLVTVALIMLVIWLFQQIQNPRRR